MKRTTGQDRSITAHWRPATQAVRGGTWRSEMGETSEALFLTSGYSYDDAATVAARQIYLSPASVLIPLLVTLALLAAGWLWASTSRGWPATGIALGGWVIVVVVAQIRADVPDWRWTAVAIAAGICCILTTAPIRSRRLAMGR